MTERRKHVRSNLRLSVFLMQADSGVLIQTQTENISNDGFFAFTDCELTAGARLKFLLLLPDISELAHAPTRICVLGELQLVRVTLNPVRQLYGLGCQLAGYHVLPDPGYLTIEELARKALGPT